MIDVYQSVLNGLKLSQIIEGTRISRTASIFYHILVTANTFINTGIFNLHEMSDYCLVYTVLNIVPTANGSEYHRYKDFFIFEIGSFRGNWTFSFILKRCNFVNRTCFFKSQNSQNAIKLFFVIHSS